MIANWFTFIWIPNRNKWGMEMFGKVASPSTRCEWWWCWRWWRGSKKLSESPHCLPTIIKIITTKINWTNKIITQCWEAHFTIKHLKGQSESLSPSPQKKKIQIAHKCSKTMEKKQTYYTTEHHIDLFLNNGKVSFVVSYLATMCDGKLCA